MVYVKRWSEFKARALALHAAQPKRVRGNTYTGAHGAQSAAQDPDTSREDHRRPRGTPPALTQTLKYRAKSQIILNRFDELQRLMLEAMAGIEVPPPAPEPEPASAAPPAPKSGGKKKKGKKK